MAEKRKYPVVPCPKCGGLMKRATKNQKRCLTCRLGKVAAWVDGRKSKCRGCGRKYIAWGSQRDWPHCGDCLLEKMAMGLRESVEGECARHKLHPDQCSSGDTGAQTWVYSADIRLCFPCLTNPEHFEENQRLILAKVEKLQARLNPGTVVGTK